ncbi:MAG: hypothetical protein JWP49_2792 [Phenylobacterium sp.]|nr:hypothetical protein [Phenylobacterium sp.]
MKTILLAAGAAALALSATAADAKHSKKHAMGGSAASPSQPIPYAQLDAYLKASPSKRASNDWWSGSASTGVSANASTTGASTPSATAGGDTTAGASGSVTAPTTSGSANAPGTVNPAPSATSSTSTTPPPK